MGYRSVGANPSGAAVSRLVVGTVADIGKQVETLHHASQLGERLTPVEQRAFDYSELEGGYWPPLDAQPLLDLTHAIHTQVSPSAPTYSICGSARGGVGFGQFHALQIRGSAARDA